MNSLIWFHLQITFRITISEMEFIIIIISSKTITTTTITIITLTSLTLFIWTTQVNPLILVRGSKKNLILLDKGDQRNLKTPKSLGKRSMLRRFFTQSLKTCDKHIKIKTPRQRKHSRSQKNKQTYHWILILLPQK